MWSGLLSGRVFTVLFCNCCETGVRVWREVHLLHAPPHQDIMLLHLKISSGISCSTTFAVTMLQWSSSENKANVKMLQYTVAIFLLHLPTNIYGKLMKNGTKISKNQTWISVAAWLFIISINAWIYEDSVVNWAKLIRRGDVCLIQKNQNQKTTH